MSSFLSRQFNRRKFLKLLGLGGLAAFLDACDALRAETPTATSVPLPTAVPSPTPPPPDVTARAFLDAWGKGDYAAMYKMLAPKAAAGISLDDFGKRYQSTAAEMTAATIRPQFQSLLQDGATATVQFHVRFETALFGAFEEDNALALVRENNRWGVVWSSGNIMKDLAGNNVLKFYPTKSTRGNIYDRNGQALAIGQEAIQVSVWPAEMRRQKSEAQVLAALEPVVNLSQLEIQKRYANSNPEWKVPIAVITKEVARDNADALALPGVVTEPQDARAYPPGPVAAHIGGYIGQITAEELAQVYNQGYREGDMFGRTGLEKAGEKYLAGVRGGRLVVLSPDGQQVATLKDKPAQQSQSLYTTIDLDLQTAVDAILGSRRGSIVVMNVKNGDILAMASHPSYDPNAFMDSTRSKERQSILTNPQHLLLNRVTQGQYPQGSVQKVITLAAALERGGLGQYTPFVCTGIWKALGYPKACWINAYGKTHGTIGLQHALTASCDITFYQVGLLLDKKDQELMPSFAYAFGLGQSTGVTLEESNGHVPDPKDQQPWRPTDPVDMAIGQDTFLVSPLQVVDFIAAVANGGTLWKPRLIAKVQDLVNSTEQTLPNEKRGDLPVRAGNLKIIRDGLKGVTTDKKDGTAAFVFEGLPIVCAGKTDTAQVPGAADPHAWFAGYAPADNPEIACVVMIENGGEGSKTSAPLFRKVIEKYFNVKVTPTAPGKPTPTPVPQQGD